MPGEIIGLSSPGYWVWLGPALILVVAGFSVLIISSVTRSSISAMARAAGEVLSQAEGLPHRRNMAAESLFVTEGKASARFTANAFLLRLERRSGQADEPRKFLDGLSTALIHAGFDPDDIQGENVTPSGEGSLAELSIRLSGDERVGEINRIALQAGFREDRTRPREAFDIEDLQARAGKRALARAISNVDVIREHLNLRGEVGLVEAQLSVDAPGDIDDVVVMRAKATWRVVTDTVLAA